MEGISKQTQENKYQNSVYVSFRHLLFCSGEGADINPGEQWTKGAKDTHVVGYTQGFKEQVEEATKKPRI